MQQDVTSSLTKHIWDDSLPRPRQCRHTHGVREDGVRRTGINHKQLACLTNHRWRDLPPPAPKHRNQRESNHDARSAGTLPPTLDRWSGGFSQWGQSLRPCPQGTHRSPYRGHPKGVFTGPGTRKGSIHPQKSPSQTLELQGEPPTPGNLAKQDPGKARQKR